MKVPDATEARELMTQRRRVSYEVCYCSSLGDCWLLLYSGLGSQTTVPTNGCTPDAKPFRSASNQTLDTMLVQSALKARPAVDGGEIPDAHRSE